MYRLRGHIGRCVAALGNIGMSVRHYAEPLASVTEEELKHLDQELPPRQLLQELRSSDASPEEDPDPDVRVPGDSFGIMRNRVAFYKPVSRMPYSGRLGELMPLSTHPFDCMNYRTLNLLCGRYGVSVDDALHSLAAHQGDINHAVAQLEQEKKISAGFGSFGVVCLEAYAPETFCLVSFNLPNFAATQDDDVLDAIHELTLSAAELPLDIPRSQLIDHFLRKWTTDDGTPCAEVLQDFDLTISDIVLLPYGEYSVQGFHVLHPVKPDTPNIGVGAAACCMDLRTGIHNRFRFHVERIADSISEHVVQELVHYDQGIHLLRQPYWFRPEYSVEELIRFKESLLQPSASIFEMRYAVLTAPQFGLTGYRNLVELEKLKIAQHKYEKHYEDFTSPGSWLTSDNSQLQTVAAGGGGSNAPGASMHMHTNDRHASDSAMETRVGPLRRTLETSIQAHGDRVFARFYRNNCH